MRIASGTAFLCAATALTLHWPAHARDTVVQTPSSAWQLDYGEDNCMLARSFGKEGETTTFALTMYAPDTGPSIAIARKERLRSRIQYRVQFAPDTAYTDIDHAMSAKFGEGLEGLILTFSLLPAAEVAKLKSLAESNWKDGDFSELPDWDETKRDAREREINEFRIEGAFKDDLHLKLGSMAEPMKAIRTCLDELLGHWGIDAAVQRTLSRKPVPLSNPGNWVVAKDYPRGLLASGYQGIVHFRLIVNAEGEPTNCVVQGATNPDQFADVSCAALMRNAKFSPALDNAGNPVVSYWSNSVRFMIPSS